MYDVCTQSGVINTSLIYVLIASGSVLVGCVIIVNRAFLIATPYSPLPNPQLETCHSAKIKAFSSLLLPQMPPPHHPLYISKVLHRQSALHTGLNIFNIILESFQAAQFCRMILHAG